MICNHSAENFYFDFYFNPDVVDDDEDDDDITVVLNVFWFAAPLLNNKIIWRHP